MRIKSAKGFSLIELLIVIAIIAILATVAAPNYNKYRYNTRLKEVARDIADDIKLYKQKAMNENTNYKISYGNNSTIYMYTCQNSTWTWSPAIPPSKAVATDSSVVISGTPNFAANFAGSNNTTTELIITPRGTMGNGSLVLNHTMQLSTATITTYFKGRVQDAYVLK